MAESIPRCKGCGFQVPLVKGKPMCPTCAAFYTLLSLAGLDPEDEQVYTIIQQQPEKRPYPYRPDEVFNKRLPYPQSKEASWEYDAANAAYKNDILSKALLDRAMKTIPPKVLISTPPTVREFQDRVRDFEKQVTEYEWQVHRWHTAPVQDELLSKVAKQMQKDIDNHIMDALAAYPRQSGKTK